jgi:DNA-nicking Smr family endonuclease
MAKQRPDRIAADDASDDMQAFRAAMRDVTPLAETPAAAGLAAPRRRVRTRAKNRVLENLDVTMPLIGALPADGALPDGAASEDAVTAEQALTFARAGVRMQVMRRLRRGLLPVDDELDLHGLDQTAARHRLAEFIARSRNDGCRCVRIIHGKGYRSGARGPVLKAAVNLWLRRHMGVLAFVSARAIDGGTGAVYVLLRA